MTILLSEADECVVQDRRLSLSFFRVPEIGLELNEAGLKRLGDGTQSSAVLTLNELISSAEQCVAEERFEIGELPRGVELVAALLQKPCPELFPRNLGCV